MELIGTNQQNKDIKTKKIMIGISVTIVLLLLVSIVLFVAIYYLKDKQFKFYIDDKNVAMTSEDLFVYENNNVYISLKDIAPFVGYKYYNGGYKQYSEDDTKCYLESDYEVATLDINSETIYKTPVDELNYEYFTIKEPIKSINGKLYVTSEDLGLICNLKFYYEQEKNKISIYTLPFYTNYYTTNYTLAAVSDNFKNQKALLYNLLVVKDSANTEENQVNSYNSKETKYGVYTLEGKEVIGTKYTDIEFIESAQEFIVKTEEEKVGIITSDGKTRVTPQYDSLKQIDKNLNLYLVTSNNKKGVIEKNGKILIYPEYDEIGIDTTEFQNNDIKNSYLLFENIIPVKQNGKWGMFNKNGQQVLPLDYDGIGCLSEDKTFNNVVIIPDVKAIVVAKNYIIENNDDSQNYSNNKKTTKTLYGIVNYSGKLIVPAALESVYSVTSNGRDEFTMVYNNKKYDLVAYIESQLKDKTSENN